MDSHAHSDQDTRRPWTPRPICRVFLLGDASPIYADLTVDALTYKLGEIETFAADAGTSPAFVRLPLLRGKEALVRPSAIAAILPGTYDPDNTIGSDDGDDD